MDVDVRVDVESATKGLNDLFKKQIPFATANAINKTLFGLKTEQESKIKEDLDNPTPWTIRGHMVDKANKQTLTGSLFIHPDRYKYLKFQIEGGIRTPTRKAIAVPTRHMKVNKFGNMTRNKVSTLLNNKKNFSGKVKGVGGIWQRKRTKKKNSIKLLIAWEPQVNYSKRYRYYEHAKNYINRSFNANLTAAIDYAIRTAK